MKGPDVNHDIYATTRRRDFTAEELDRLLRDVDKLIDQASKELFIHRTMDLLVHARAALELYRRFAREVMSEDVGLRVWDDPTLEAVTLRARRDEDERLETSP